MDIHNMLIIQSLTMHGLMVEEIVERIFFLHRYDSRKKKMEIVIPNFSYTVKFSLSKCCREFVH